MSWETFKKYANMTTRPKRGLTAKEKVAEALDELQTQRADFVPYVESDPIGGVVDQFSQRAFDACGISRPKSEEPATFDLTLPDETARRKAAAIDAATGVGVRSGMR